LPDWLTPTQIACCAAHKASCWHAVGIPAHTACCLCDSKIQMQLQTRTSPGSCHCQWQPNKANGRKQHLECCPQIPCNQLQPQNGGRATPSSTNHSTQQNTIRASLSVKHQNLPHSNCCSADAQAR
jgi:hypothetical protein